MGDLEKELLKWRVTTSKGEVRRDLKHPWQALNITISRRKDMGIVIHRTGLNAKRTDKVELSGVERKSTDEWLSQ